MSAWELHLLQKGQDLGYCAYYPEWPDSIRGWFCGGSFGIQYVLDLSTLEGSTVRHRTPLRNGVRWRTVDKGNVTHLHPIRGGE